MTLISLSIGFVVGLVVGWNFFEQPEFVKNWFRSEDKS